MHSHRRMMQQTVGLILAVYLCMGAAEAADFWPDLVECSHEFSNKTVWRGQRIQSGGWVPPQFLSADGRTIPCGMQVNAGDHTLMVHQERFKKGAFIVEAISSAPPDERHGFDQGGMCGKTRVVDQEKSHFVVPSVEKTTIMLRSVYADTREADKQLQIYVSYECMYDVIPSVARLQELEKELAEKLRKEAMEEQERARQAEAEGIEETVQEVEEITE